MWTGTRTQGAGKLRTFDTRKVSNLDKLLTLCGWVRSWAAVVVYGC